ncbi:hypothetical protein LWI29_037217 [Acer saccharum]|uniref:BIG2 domain-containing protein n=1 Tax=Acer saccharum TaxID=4024 RepID=A0AA39VS52_ACESA|nr:hypothetical protein LWI29_037217 [Acer saccharum]
MSRFTTTFWSLLVLLAVAVEQTTSLLGSGPHITDVNILLPPKITNPVEYRLQGSDGCFKWSWDHHDFLSVLPEYNSSNRCSTSARLRSIAPYSGRKETAVYATDVHSGIVIRCKVFIDIFSRIQIFHNSIKLDLDGLATLHVRAFDSQDNVFSSLVGLQFMWQLMPETDGTHHLVHVPLKDSPLSDCGGLCGDLDIQIILENSGVFSDLYVVKGVEIGLEKVSVHLLEPEFKDMADNIVLTVAEAMSLEPPSPVYVLIGAAFQYSLKVIHENIPEVVTLPSLHHNWSVSNPSIAQVDTMMGVTRAISLGETVVIVEDTRVAGHIQVSTLNVVLPDTLCLYISPLSGSGDPVEGTEAIPSVARWYVVSGRQYLIRMKVFSPGPSAQEIYITKNDDVKLFDNQSEYWKTFLVSDDIVLKHGWRNSTVLKATSQGMGKLTASLTYFSGRPDTKEVLKVVQEIMVCDQVKFSLDRINDMSQSILLPWAPGVYQEVELKATGGCAKASSDYKWFSSDMDTVSISAFGTVQAKKPGKTTIKVVSVFDSFNYDEVVIEVSIPSSMVMLQNFHVETVVGSHLQAAVTLKASNGAYFYKCDAFSSLINWKPGSLSFTVVNATEKIPFFDNLETSQRHTSVDGPLCSWTSLYASGPDRTMLHATLSKEPQQFDHSFHGPIVLKASLRIAAYPPLIVQQAGDGSQFGGYWFNLDQSETGIQLENLDKLYLSPGTNMHVSLAGGPEPWDEGVDYIDTYEILNARHAHTRDGVHVHLISGSHNLYEILCQELGTFNLFFKRGNLVGDDHPLPAISEVSLSLTCGFPSSIALLVDEPVNKREVIQTANQADRSPGRIRVTPITVANGQTIRLAAVGISNTGEAFANSSSLCMRWELSSCEGLAYLDDAYGSQRSKSSWERFLVLQNESGLCVVRASVTGVCDAFSGGYSAQLFKTSENVLTDAIRLQLVSTLRVNPEFNLLFFNPDAKVNLSITGGSCFLKAVVNDSQVVEVIQSPPGLQCSQLMLSPKGLGTALVSVYDVGLAPPHAASALIQVADVDWIKIVSGEEISLMEGQSQSIELMAGIDDGSTFDSSQYAYMDIHAYIKSHIVELVDDDDVSNPDGGYVSSSSFKIMGKQLGITTLYVSTRQQSGQEIVSQAIKVEVYAPPRIHPLDIFLVPGASYTLTLKGGPTIGIYVEYASMEDKIATVHKSSGQLFAISPGNTTLFATVFGNGDVVICKAYGSVIVGLPSSLILNVQSEQLAVGREMPIYPLFPEGNLFSFYELCKNYNWTIEDEKVLNFHMGENHGAHLVTSGDVQPVSYLDEKQVGYIRVLYGRSAGRTNVVAAFSCDFISDSYSQSRSYSASISLSVVPDLPLALGVPITWVLPPHYTTSGLLPSSPESRGQWDSQSYKGTITYSILRYFSEKNEPLNEEDISIDGDRIKTRESNNLACIQAKDRSTGRIEIASCVRVAEVAQIRIRNKEFPTLLAVGAELEIPISYYDALGNPFHEAHNAIFYHAETNYRDIVSIDDTHYGNGKIHLKALRHGRALVQVSINNSPRKSDYVLISVGAHVYPLDPVLHVGNDLDFSVQGFNDQVFGHWLSANESVISVDRSSGKAEAVGIGSTQVLFECPSMKLQTTVTVVSRNIVSVDAPKEMLTNVPYPTRGYSFSVSFSDTHKKFAALENKGVSYDCKVEPSFIGYARPWMDLDTGNLYCLFFPYSPEHLVRSIQKSKDMIPYISVSINASLRGAHHVSGSASALFVGGFSVLEMDKNSLQLNLTPDSNQTTITVVGNTDVEIHWDNQDLIKISPIHKEDFGIGGHARYEVKVLRAKKFEDKITITLPANGQRVEIGVNYEPKEKVASSTSIKEILSVAILGICTLIGLIAGIVLCNLEKQARSSPSQPSTSPATPSRTALLTPERSSPGVANEQTPRTPQPFVEYVRRTIDETPYYTREARRRFNPQNTF